jgi:acetylornithine deacetylase/succinyl-diaminopimelate desuccinylase-like protein
VHSGSAGGVVPSSFRLLRSLLDRVEDASTGELRIAELHAPIPPDRATEIATTAAELGLDGVSGGYPVLPGADAESVLRARTWEPSLAYVGADGFPPVATAGNVLRASTALKLSFRLPPTADADAAAEAVTAALLADPPAGAHVDVHGTEAGPGWNAPPFEAWLVDALDAASRAAYGEPARTIGEGGSIPFMGMLGARFPTAQFLITGVLGAGANAHGPNESLHVPYAVRLTEAVAHVLRSHAGR